MSSKQNASTDFLLNFSCLSRSCIVGCFTTENYFLAKGGVFLLLELLSVCSSLQRTHLCFYHSHHCITHWNIHPAPLHSIVEPAMHLFHYPGDSARAVRQPQHPVSRPQVAGQQRPDGSQSPAAAMERRGGEVERQPEPPGSDCRSACGSTVCFEELN